MKIQSLQALIEMLANADMDHTLDYGDSKACKTDMLIRAQQAAELGAWLERSITLNDEDGENMAFAVGALMRGELDFFIYQGE